MLNQAQVGLLFIALAVLFFGLSLRDYLKSGARITPARRAWLRVGIIFAIVGVFLYLAQAG
jgi:hypothetical protein